MKIRGIQAITQAQAELRKWASIMAAYEKQIATVKRQIGGASWYPHSSPPIFSLLSRNAGASVELYRALRSGPVLDLGCGDGLLGLFVETQLGIKVCAVDYPATNFNGMRGVHLLREAVQSKMEIRECDLDESLDIGEQYAVTFLLGVLYHLANPFRVLRHLAKRTRYCVLSTRVAQQTPDGSVIFGSQPVAYFSFAGEIANDCTNYWVFSPAALRRMVQRAGFELLGWEETGARVGSDPVHPERDQRIFCVLRSRLPNAWYVVRPKYGLYEPEGGWTWTAPRFAFTVEDLSGDACGFQFDFDLHPAVFLRSGDVSISVWRNGRSLGQLFFQTPGRNRIEMTLDEGDAVTELLMEFQIDPAIHREGDSRDLGVLLTETDGDHNLRLIHPVSPGLAD